MTHRIILLLAILFVQRPVLAQSKWHTYTQVNFGCNIFLTYGKAQHFPGLRIFGGGSINGTHKSGVMLNYGPSLAIYTKTTGANLNPLVGDIQLDFTNSFSAGYAWGGWLDYVKLFRTLHNADYYNVGTMARNAAMLTSNFILNNHGRNQVNGAVTGTFGLFTFNYYNDGAIPFNVIPVADNFDRYWTGGGGIIIHTREGFNRVEVNFDQFTGYTPLLYELSNILGINLPLYDESKDRKGRNQPYNFNTSAYQVKVFTSRNFAVDAGIIGNLMDKAGWHYGIQDIIHMKLGMSLHPNNDNNRFFFGGSYNNLQHVDF
ncbi:hypothetical protein [Chitinophaga sp. MM2321]|uniref:hypothetical protein n=1 Tax=Chitinophaga sp. MM2321 TaxID=3137178 RepID=UPI0032D576D7